MGVRKKFHKEEHKGENKLQWGNLDCTREESHWGVMGLFQEELGRWLVGRKEAPGSH